MLRVIYPTITKEIITDLERNILMNNVPLQLEPSVSTIAQEEDLLTFKEAMSFLRISRSTLYRLMWSGKITGHKVGSTWRFYRRDVYACPRASMHESI
jgi:excisionase family DNA binding protein